MTATVFLRSSDQEAADTNVGFLSEEIVSPPNGSIIIQVDGLMETAERWVIEQAMVGSDDWEAVHRTDTPSGMQTMADWQGPRASNRVFVVAVSDACRYRLRKVSSTTTGELSYNRPITTGTFPTRPPNGTAPTSRSSGLTAFWAEWQTRLSL